MGLFQKTVTCPVCQGDGTAVYSEVGKGGSRLQSLDCSGGCWLEGAPGAGMIKMLNDAPVVER